MLYFASRVGYPAGEHTLKVQCGYWGVGNIGCSRRSRPVLLSIPHINVAVALLYVACLFECVIKES